MRCEVDFLVREMRAFAKPAQCRRVEPRAADL
jgi:hypothetical protein